MNGKQFWIALSAVLLTVFITFGGAMLRAGEIEYKVNSNTKTVEMHDERIDSIEQGAARTEEHLEHIDQTLGEIKVLLQNHMDSTNEWKTLE